MTRLHGTTYCESVPCSLKGELPKQTNADRIRGMSDKELAEFLFCHIDKIDEYMIIDRIRYYDETDVLEWLGSEVEENDA